MLNQNNFIPAVERGILATYLYADLFSTELFEKITNETIDPSLFKTNITAKAVAKAIFIFQQKDIPLDEMLIKEFIEKKMPMDYDEYLKILTTVALEFHHFKYYVGILRKERKKLLSGLDYARI